MAKAFVTLVSYGNGIFMMGIFGLVCLILVAAVLISLFSDKKNQKPE
ncbi:hypothetical protein [Jiulongibacter sediminis]|nr:hypothetical protein [Jiulongibacter sediminis]